MSFTCCISLFLQLPNFNLQFFIQIFNKLLLPNLPLFNLLLSILDMLFVLLNQIFHCFLHHNDVIATFVYYLVDFHDMMTLLKVTERTPIAYQLLFLNAHVWDCFADRFYFLAMPRNKVSWLLHLLVLFTWLLHKTVAIIAKNLIFLKQVRSLRESVKLRHHLWRRDSAFQQIWRLKFRLFFQQEVKWVNDRLYFILEHELEVLDIFRHCLGCTSNAHRCWLSKTSLVC